MAQTGDYFCFGMLNFKAQAFYEAPDAQGIQQFNVTAEVWLHAWCLGLNCEGNTWFFDLSQGGFVYDNPQLFVAKHNDPDRELAGLSTEGKTSPADEGDVPQRTKITGRGWYDLGCCDCDDPIDPYDYDIIEQTTYPGVVTSETPPVIQVSPMATGGHSGESAINVATRSGKKSDCYVILKRKFTFSGTVDYGRNRHQDIHISVGQSTSRNAIALADAEKASGSWSCRKNPTTSTAGRSYQAGS